MKLRIKRLDERAQLPTRKHPTDSGMDLYACIPEGSVQLRPGERRGIGTGIAIELPPADVINDAWGGTASVGLEAQVRPRSGLKLKHGIMAGFGTIDNGYRGEIGVTLFNHSYDSYTVRHGDRIAQLVVCPVVYPEVEEVTELSETERGAGGFGSTGV
jgi:dUTP pyrophosphatase